MLCASWLVFFRYLSRHPELLEAGVEPGFFRRKTARAWVGLVLYYVAAGVLGGLITPIIALVIFLAVPVFYAMTSHGLYELSSGRHRH